MEKEQRTRLQKATQEARRLLEEEFRSQLLETYDINVEAGRWKEEPGAHLQAEQRLIREKLVAWIEHKEAQINDRKEALLLALREMAFTTLNRFVALKLMEARELVRPCVSGGFESEGFQEFTAVAQGLLAEQESSYRLYLETIFEDVSRELRALFDPRDPASLLWPKRTALLELLEILNKPEIGELWSEDETLGWVYQFFNSKEERQEMRKASAPRNSRELAVRNQFFTPRYVVKFLTDNTIGRIWHEMTQGQTHLKEQCRYLLRRPDEVFLAEPNSDEVRAAQAWLQSGDGERPDLWHLAHTVNGYARAGQAGEDSNRWVEERLPRIKTETIQSLTTQELLDLLFLFCRKERFCEGTLDVLNAEIDLILITIEDRCARGRSEDHSQEDLLKQPIFIPHRKLKDPRTIRMLDPACGSMHFGLYAFDLFELIYHEAWELERQMGADGLTRQGALQPLHSTYTSKADYERDIPRLILAHNIHGIDIDPRAVQISGLTLWLRAQRSWQGAGVAVVNRPPVRRAQVACAEPMPGEENLLGELLDRQFDIEERPPFEYLLRGIFESMNLAGEAGSLLQVEDEIRAAIVEARQLAREHTRPVQRVLFAELEAPNQVELDLSSINRADFWHEAEGRIFAALNAYASHAQLASGFQRRIFADDTAEGFAFVDVLTNQYDAILMNPPFGEQTSRCATYFQERFTRTCVDFYAMFYERSLGLLHPGGKVGAISNRTWLGLPTFEALRTQVFGELGCVEVAADLGSFVLDAQVETVALVAGLDAKPEQKALWIRLLKTKSKQTQLLSALQALPAGSLPNFCFMASQRELASLPTGVYGYWMSHRLINLYQPEHAVRLRGAAVKQGTATADDFRFLRLAWEVSPEVLGIDRQWARFAKGGEYQNFFDDVHLAIRWEREGKEIAAFPSAYIRNATFYGRPGVTWPLRTTSPFGPRAFPSGCVFGHKGPVAVPFDDVPPSLLLGLLAAKPTKLLLSVRLGAGDDAPGSASKSYEVGLIRDLPFPDFQDQAQSLQDLTNEATLLVRSVAVEDDETTALFCLPALARLAGERSLRDAAALVVNRREQAFARLAAIQARIDDLVAGALCFEEPDLEVLWEELEPPLLAFPLDNTAPPELFTQAYLTKQAIPGDSLPGGLDAETDVRVQTRRKQQVALRGFESICRLFEIHPDRFLEQRRSLGLTRQEDLYALSASLVSYCMGCVFGRWDVQLATGHRSAPELPDPFAALPNCAPGQLQDDAGLPLQQGQLAADYPLSIAWDGVLITDPGHPLDLLGRVQQAIAVIFPGRDDAIAQEASCHLGVSRLDEYLSSPTGFFADHVKRYSKSRRQAPIYWQLSAGGGSYSIWLYYHRLTADTLYQVLGLVKLRLEDVEREIRDLGANTILSGDEAIRLQEAQALLADLRVFKNDLDMVAPLWNPSLNDGVIINHAILWRITPNAPWQKKCKECWEKLVAGDYDWSHLAFHLWPELVIPKCTTDRSLAIAHGLEDRLWQETNNGNWLPRQISGAELEAMIAEHSKPALRSALERFLAAPPPAAPPRARAPRAARSSSTSSIRRPRGSTTAVDADAARQTMLVLTAAPAEGLSRNDIATALEVEPSSITPVIKHLKESGQIEQLGTARGTRYRLTELGRTAVESDDS